MSSNLTSLPSMGRLANEEGFVLESEFAFVPAQFDSPVLHHNPADGCHLLSTFSIRNLDPGGSCGTCFMSTDRCGQRIMPSYLLIQNRECSAPGKGGIADFCPNGFKLAASIPAAIDAIANQDISCHQPASTFANISPPRQVLTISETYDHITAIWCAPNVRRPSSKRN